MGASRNRDAVVVNNRAFYLLLILAGFVLTGCSGTVTETEAIKTSEDYQILVTGVSVAQSDKIELTGTTSLPDGNCVYTKLSHNGTDVDWWPVGKCFPISGPDWRFSIPLGVEGAPEKLEHQADYVIKVWWPGAPGLTKAEFSFDTGAPPAP